MESKSAKSKKCKNCAEQFLVVDKDIEYYKKIGVPVPTFCPDCRFQRRLATRCERSLYKRKCDLCGKDMISIYKPESPFPVYCRECFWSDKWDPFKYGKNFDFNRPFFEQFKELQDKVPRLMIFTNKSQNCDYTCHSFQNKDCYLSFGVKDCEDMYYVSKGVSSKNCLDCLMITNCELCFACIDCFNCYNCKFLQNCKNCTDCIQGWDLVGCQNCYGCAGLRRKKYYIFNEPKTKEEYFKEIEKFNITDKKKFSEIKLKTPHKYLNVLNNQNCSGDYLYDSKNSNDCYDSDNLEDCGHCTFIFRDKDCYDMYAVGDSELGYENMGVEEIYNLKFSFTTDNTKNSTYLSLCFGSENLFGCIGLRHQKHCILNKQYSKEEHEKLLPLIIDHMTKTGEWGEYMPINISPYAYNESVANEYFPLTGEEALKKGYDWKNPDLKEYKQASGEILACKNCKKNYKIIPPELKFYKKQNLIQPEFCPNCRHLFRLAKRNPMKIYDRNCDKCGTKINTTYSPDRKEIIYCEKCYLETIG